MGFDKLRILNDREKARDKLPIFYGSRDNYLHGFREVCINNTIDEITNNFDSGDIYITLHNDNKTITVEDTGRGMPIGEESNGTSNWEIFFTILFASGKYDLENAENSGVNGVGGVVLQFSSLLYSVESWYDNKHFIIEFENGGDIKTPISYLGETTKHGTKITFKLDDECYTNTTYRTEDLVDIINKVSSSSPKTTIHYTYKGETKHYHYDTILEYYKKNISNENFNFICNQKTYKDTIEFIDMDGSKHSHEETTKVECIFSSSVEPKQESYLNRNYLSEGGTINDGLIEGIKLYCHKYIKRRKLYEKKEKSISLEDVRNSISFVINVLSSNVEFESQTKFSSKKDLYNKVVKRFVQEYLEIFEIEKKDEFEDFINQILLTKRVNEKAEENRKSNRKKLENKTKSKKTYIEKLSPCSSKNPKECEIHLFEGDSAGGNAKQSRDRKFQATLPQRGKSKNTIKGGDNSIDSEVLKNIKDSCGFEYGDDYRESDLNYWKIVLQADGDDDGAYHIVPLWLTYFYTKVPKLIEDGHLYIAQPPLYRNKLKDKTEVYTYSEKEQLEFLKCNKPIEIQRYKGLGEMNPEQLWETTLNPKTRRLIQVKIDNFDKADETFELLMGTEVKPRRDFIVNFAKESEC